MKLKAEWAKRITDWMEELPAWFYVPLGKVSCKAYFTKEFLPMDTVGEMVSVPIEEGTAWGSKWEYGWFSCEVVLPAQAEGKRIVLVPKIGGEMLVFVNGEASGAIDSQHSEITLTKCGRKETNYRILIESYAGHGPRLEGAGPCPKGRVTVTEPPETQCVYKGVEYGIFMEDAFLLYMDVFALVRLYEKLDEKSLRAMKIREALEEFTRVVDFEAEREQVYEMFSFARSLLQPLLLCHNGSTAPEMTIFGQSHLDLAWKWPWEETRRKCARTLSTQLALMEEYPEYRFLLCEPPIMESVKADYPKLYKRIREKVASGQMIPEGGMYVEADTNLPAGECLIRQCLWGKQWFLEEFGCDTQMVWLPDCFGFSGQLPQIMKKTGMKYFTTQKIARARAGSEVFPYNIFWWEGIDGSRILTHFFKKNNARYSPDLLIERWENDRVQQYHMDTMLYPFGFGDGGGGATREMLEQVARTKDLEGAPRTKMQSPVAFFEELQKKEYSYDVFRGEIYLAWHRGTYTAQARTKRGNRKAETALHDAELLQTLYCTEYAKERLTGLWRKLLFHQFHDILPGSSIARVHQEAEKAFHEIREGADELAAEALMHASTDEFHENSNAVTVFNTLSWERTETLPLFENADQSTEYRTVTLPACGYATFYRNDSEKECKKISNSPSVTAVKETLNGVTRWVLKNAKITAVMDEHAQLVSYIDNETKTEWMEGAGNRFLLYQDINVDYDAWEIASYYKELLTKETLCVQEIKPVCTEDVCKLFVRGTLHASALTQEIILEADSPVLKFHTTIDWQETHKLLKVAFPAAVHTEDACEEIQFGYVKRPTHRSRRNDADRYEVCNHKYTALSEPSRTFALLNDCKYGVSTEGNEIALTLLRAPMIPDMNADKGIQEMTYAVMAEPLPLAKSSVMRQGYALNYLPVILRGWEGKSLRSYLTITQEAVVLESMKPSEDGNDIILRLYEAFGGHTATKLILSENSPLSAVRYQETDMREQEIISEGMLKDGVAELSFTPFEIKTIRLIRQ